MNSIQLMDNPQMTVSKRGLFSKAPSQAEQAEDSGIARLTTKRMEILDELLEIEGDRRTKEAKAKATESETKTKTESVTKVLEFAANHDNEVVSISVSGAPEIQPLVTHARQSIIKMAVEAISKISGTPPPPHSNIVDAEYEDISK